jgi:hypothetical protein
MASLPPQDQNPYAPSPGCAAGGGYLPDGQPLLREEVEAFAGRNGRVYWDLLEPARHSRSLFAGFNVAAAAFSFLWLLHRKGVAHGHLGTVGACHSRPCALVPGRRARLAVPKHDRRRSLHRAGKEVSIRFGTAGC